MFDDSVLPLGVSFPLCQCSRYAHLYESRINLYKSAELETKWGQLKSNSTCAETPTLFATTLC